MSQHPKSFQTILVTCTAPDHLVKKCVDLLRKRYPGASICGLMNESQIDRLAPLFHNVLQYQGQRLTRSALPEALVRSTNTAFDLLVVIWNNMLGRKTLSLNLAALFLPIPDKMLLCPDLSLRKFSWKTLFLFPNHICEGALSWIVFPLFALWLRFSRTELLNKTAVFITSKNSTLTKYYTVPVLRTGTRLKLVKLSTNASPLRQLIFVVMTLRQESGRDIVIDYIPLVFLRLVLTFRLAGYRVSLRLIGDVFAEDFEKPGKRFYFLQTRLALRFCNSLLPISQFLARKYLRFNKNIYVIYNPVLWDRNSSPNKRKPLLFTAMNFKYYKKVKGLVDFLPVIDNVLTEHPSLEFLIAGDGRYSLFVQSAIQKLNNRDRIKSPGFLHNPLPIFDECLIYLHLSGLDTLPNAILEAMSRGCICVATATGGIPEIITDGVNGFLVPPAEKGKSSFSTLQTLLSKILHNQVDTDFIRSNAVKTVSEKFSVERISQEWSRILL